MTMKRASVIGVAILAASCFFLLPSSWGVEKYPSRPIDLIVPAGPGGTYDTQSRILTTLGNQYLGQPLVVSFKPGAGNIVGSAFVARAKPDGYTLLLVGTGGVTISPQLENTGYTKDDFMPIAQLSYTPSIVAVRADKPWKSLGDLVNYVRTNWEKAVFGTTAVTGVGGFGHTMLLKSGGIKTPLPTIVAFPGVSQSILSLLKGDTEYTVELATGVMPFIRSKEVRVLAVLDEKRFSFLPDVPTAKEAGFDVTSKMWVSILVPKKTPTEIIETLSGAFARVVKDPSYIAYMEKVELPSLYMDRLSFQKYWDDEYEKYGEIIKSLNLKKK